MLKSNIDVFFVTSFLCSLKFVLFYRIVLCLIATHAKAATHSLNIGEGSR